jgi:hypothetical protein
VAVVALLVGLLIAVEGLMGLVIPGAFVSMVRFFQLPPVLYVAAVVRVLIGVVLVRAAPASRAPIVLRILGFVVVIGGLLTPFVGARLAERVLGWWTTGGTGVVRMWAGFALVVGVIILYAVAPKRRAA